MSSLNRDLEARDIKVQYSWGTWVAQVKCPGLDLSPDLDLKVVSSKPYFKRKRKRKRSPRPKAVKNSVDLEGENCVQRSVVGLQEPRTSAS